MAEEFTIQYGDTIVNLIFSFDVEGGGGGGRATCIVAKSQHEPLCIHFGIMFNLTKRFYRGLYKIKT